MIKDEDCFNCTSPITACDCGHTEGYSNHGPVCPHCAYREDDLSGGELHDESIEEWTCSSCGETYKCSLATTYAWTTNKIKDPQ